MTDSLSQCEFSLRVNGKHTLVRACSMERLLDVLRERLKLTGTKEGCGEGECGACAVLIDGQLVDSCLVPVMQAAGSSIVTIEGLTRDAWFRTLQETFLEYGGAQCGICTPGMILASVNLLSKNPTPTMDDIREGLSGNLCRCTGYIPIVAAILEARAAYRRRT
jgi:aerobic carbon-monoxide dehydrogenase small subunit